MISKRLGRQYEVVLDMDEVRAILPLRPKNIHKGTAGKVLVVAGSRGLTGAAVLSSRATLRAGAGLATLATPASLADLIDIHNLEVMTFPLLETATGAVAKEAFPVLQELLPRFDILLIGPGLSGNKNSVQLVIDILQYISRKLPHIKVVVDADGLKALKKIYRPLQMPWVITPHVGELGAILQRTTREILEKPYYYARRAADKYNCVVVLKSAQTYIAEQGAARYFLTLNGNPGMATAGAGDVLAGLLAGLWVSNRLSVIKVAAAAAYLHAVAGNIAANKKSVDGIIASDILEEIPAALKLVKGL